MYSLKFWYDKVWHMFLSGSDAESISQTSLWHVTCTLAVSRQMFSLFTFLCLTGSSSSSNRSSQTLTLREKKGQWFWSAVYFRMTFTHWKKTNLAQTIILNDITAANIKCSWVHQKKEEPHMLGTTAHKFRRAFSR